MSNEFFPKVTAIEMDLIYELINASHNPSLVCVDDSPNANIIHHIYDDGEITAQKGGFAYLQRTERTLSYPLSFDKNLDAEKFPHKRTTPSRTYGYAIVTLEDGKKIRDKMAEAIECEKLKKKISKRTLFLFN